MNKLKQFWYHWRQAKYLPDDALINEQSQTKLSITLILLMALITIILIIWAMFAKIEETELSYGTVVPKEKITVRQELGGGKVDKVFVSDGDIVKEGQALLILNREIAKHQLQKNYLQTFLLQLDILRWQTLADNGSDLTAAAKAKFSPADMSWLTPEQFNGLVNNAQQQLNLQIQTFKQQKNFLQNQISQEKEEAQQLDKRYQLLENNLNLLKQQMDMYQKLITSHAVAKNDIMDLQRKINDVEGEIAKLLTERAGGEQNLLNIQNELDNLSAKQQQTALQQVNTLNSNLLNLTGSINDLTHMINALTIKAPVSGVIENINTQPGDYVETGKNLLTIVPLQKELVVVARVNTNRVSRVSIGEPVRLRVLAKDENYISLTGKVISLSDRSYTDQNNDAYYLATISIDSYIVKKHDTLLLPGTNVEAYISIGKKSLLKYLMST